MTATEREDAADVRARLQMAVDCLSYCLDYHGITPGVTEALEWAKLGVTITMLSEAIREVNRELNGG